MAKKRGKTKSSKNSKKTKRQNRRRKILKFALIFVAILILLATLLFGAVFIKAWNSTGEITDENFWIASSSTNLYDRNDDYILSLTHHGTDWVSLYDENGDYYVSEYYINALIATEDSKYWDHRGIDVAGLIKSTFTTLFTDDIRGGSTITMQLAKLLYMPDWEEYYLIDPENEDSGYTNKKSEEPIKYKMTQIAYALQIERKYEKDEILENYINFIYFGEAGYGIENASQYYYGKSSSDLTLTESATLAGMTQLPSVYNPYTNPEGTEARRNDVLYRMYAEKYITEDEYLEAIDEPIDETLVPYEETQASTYQIYSGYIDQVYYEFNEIFNEDLDFLDEDYVDITTAGVDIYTNVDPELQEATFNALNNPTTFSYPDEYLEAGSVTLDTQTGEILAIGNGRNHYSIMGTNYATNYYRQPGSTAKPIIDYGPAIEYLGWSTAHVVVDEPISYDGDDGIEIGNADGQYLGSMSMLDALAKSRNTTALATFKEVSNEVGVGAIMDFASGLGISDIHPETFNQAYSIGGWTYGTTPLELAGAYAAFGNGGTYNEPKAIRHIEINETSPLYDEYGSSYTPKTQSHTAMKHETSYMISYMLSVEHPQAAGYSSTAAIPGMSELSVKTGTTNWGENSYEFDDYAVRDKWIVGYTPNVTTAVWTGYTYEYESQGYTLDAFSMDATNIFIEIMTAANNSTSEYLHNDSHTKPSNVEVVYVLDGVYPYVIDEVNGYPHLFIVGSDDYEDLNNTFSASTASSPNVSHSIDTNAQTITLTWSYEGEFRDTSTWEITIDGKPYKIVTDTYVTIPYSDLAEYGGCKTDYQVGVQLIETNPNTNETRESNTTYVNISFESDSFCQVDEIIDEEPIDEELVNPSIEEQHQVRRNKRFTIL